MVVKIPEIDSGLIQDLDLFNRFTVLENWKTGSIPGLFLRCTNPVAYVR